MSNPAEKVTYHPFNLRYLRLRLSVAFIRFVAGLAQWIGIRQQNRLMPAGVVKRRIRVASRDVGRTIKVDVYEPKGSEGSRGVHINWHGSGFVIPSLGTDTAFCTRLCAFLGLTVLDADYRKAPESPFPAAYFDAEDLLSYAQSQYPHDSLTVGGFSAGGNLALAVSAQEATKGVVKGVVGVYPPVVLGQPRPLAPETTTFDCGIIVSKALSDLFNASYLLPSVDPLHDPRVSPHCLPTEAFPKHVFLACGKADTLHVTCEAFAKRLEMEGSGDVVWMSVEREAHAFDKRFKVGSPTEARVNTMYEGAIALLKRAHGL